VNVWWRWRIGRRLASCIDDALFVVGAGRSGTTVLCEMLDRHSHVLMARGEGPLVHRFGVLAYEYLGGPKASYYRHNTALGEEEFRESVRRLCFSCMWGPWGRVGLMPSCSKTRGLQAVAAKPFRLWGVKAFPDERSAAGLIQLFPNAKFIYIFRDGTQVVRSMSKFPSFSSMSFEERCRFWRERVFRYEYLRRHERAVCVRFEELVECPREMCGRLFAHLGLPEQDGVAEYSSTTLIHPLDEPTRADDPKRVFAARPPAHASWGDAEKRTFEKLCGPAMSLLGYDISF
jgi:hypothetical protein